MIYKLHDDIDPHSFLGTPTHTQIDWIQVISQEITDGSTL